MFTDEGHFFSMISNIFSISTDGALICSCDEISSSTASIAKDIDSVTEGTISSLSLSSSDDF